MAFQLSPTVCTCLQLRQASRALTSMYDQVLAPSGLRTTQFSMLASLKDGHTISQLGDMLLLEQSTVTRNIKLLQKQGYVELLAAPDDNRKKIISLTPLGRQKMKQAMPLWRQAQLKAATFLGEKQCQRLMKQLQTLMAGINREEC